jgi:hypothetical protein
MNREFWNECGAQNPKIRPGLAKTAFENIVFLAIYSLRPSSGAEFWDLKTEFAIASTIPE